jgi:regulator of replication initiation timing
LADPEGNGISARLRRLPGQLLLSLINATAILVIAAAIVTLVAISHVNHFTENVVATMTEAVLSKVDLPSKGVLANLQNLTAEVRELGNSLREIKAGENTPLQLEMTKLKDALSVLNVSVERLRSARSILTDEAIGRLGQTVTNTLMRMRNCPSSARLIAPHRPLSGKTAEARASSGNHEN